jgi:hypothetical protein
MNKGQLGFLFIVLFPIFIYVGGRHLKFGEIENHLTERPIITSLILAVTFITIINKILR